MTCKHFEAIAAALKNSKPPEPSKYYPITMSQWRADVRAIAAIAHHPRFGFDSHFYAACGYETT